MVLGCLLTTPACGTERSSSSSSDTPLRLVANVPLPGPTNRFDYLGFDATAHRLYIAHMDAGEIVVIDTQTRRVIRTIDAPGVHGVIAVPSLHRVYATATDVDQLYTIDSRTGKLLTRAAAGDYPDGLTYDRVTGHVFVSDESGGIEAVFDADGRRIATIDVGGGAGNVQYDPVAHSILAAVQTRDDMVVIDPRSNRVTQRVPLPGCDHPHGLHLDPPRRLAFVACDGNAVLLTVDLTTMKPTAKADVGGNPDVLAFDTGSRWLYVAAETGEVTVFAEQGRKLRKLGQWLLAPDAHSVAVDSRTHLSYFPLEDGGDDKPELRVMAPR